MIYEHTNIRKFNFINFQVKVYKHLHSIHKILLKQMISEGTKIQNMGQPLIEFKFKQFRE